MHRIATVWRLYDTLIYYFLTHTDNLFVPYRCNSRKTPTLVVNLLLQILGQMRPKQQLVESIRTQCVNEP